MCSLWTKPKSAIAVHLSSGEDESHSGLPFQVAQNAKFMKAPCGCRFVPLDTNLEETYAGNRKRRRLLYALRRHHSHSYANLWDRVANETFIHCQLFFDRCTPQKLRAHLPWACSAYLIVSPCVCVCVRVWGVVC